MLNIAVIDNLSARAYTLVRPAFPASFLRRSPTESFNHFMAGDVDAALLPVGCMPAIPAGTYSVLPFGIACRTNAFSVLLFCNQPLDRIAAQSAPIHVIPDSQSARRLLQVLYRLEYGRFPLLTDRVQDAQAFLVIGDKAMTYRAEGCPWSTVVDLGLWWHRRTGLPFVFAQWVLRANVGRDLQLEVAAWLEECTRRAESPDGRATLAEDGMRANLFEDSLEKALTYYDSLHTRLGDDDLAGLNLFMEKEKELPPCNQNA